MLPYYLSKIIVDTPMIFIPPFIGALITYWVLGFYHSLLAFFKYFLSQALVCFVASAIGYFISAIFEDETTAMGLAPSMVMPMVLFGGMLANNENLPDFLKWFQYISPIKYSAESMMWNEFDNDTEYNIGPTIMEFLGYKLDYAKCMYIFLGLAIGFRIIAFFMFRVLVKKF